MQTKNYVLIITKDKRNLFTKKENLPALNDFLTLFSSKVFIVNAPNAKLLSTNQLAKDICSTLYHDDSEFEVVERLIFKKST